MATITEVRDKADYVRRLASDLRALELFSNLTPEDVNGIGDTVDQSFYSDYDVLGIEAEHADYLMTEKGVDLGREFDYLIEIFDQLTDYDPEPYETVVAELNAAAACLSGNNGVASAFSDLAAGTPDSTDIAIPDVWQGDFIDAVRDHVVAPLPYHRIYHLALISQLIDITHAHMVIHQTVLDGLYSILESTRQKLQATIDESSSASPSLIHIGQIAVALLQIGVVAATGPVGVMAAVGVAMLNAGVVAASAASDVTAMTEAAKDDADSTSVPITGDTSFDIIDSMHSAVGDLTSMIPTDEHELGSRVAEATESLDQIVKDADTNHADDRSKFAWHIVPLRPAIADTPPSSDSDFNYRHDD